MNISLEVNLGSLRLQNPLILASGILDISPSLLARVANNGFGAVVTKSFTREKREGYKTPIIVATKCGFINAVGLENPGADALEEFIAEYKGLSKVPIIVSIAGSSARDFTYVAKKAEDAGADALELNMSCPHVRGKGLDIGSDPKLIKKIVTKVRKAVNIPIFVKLGLCDNLIKCAKNSEIAGADGIVLINTIRAMIIDVWIMRPILSNKFGGLSGPAIHPIAVRCVYEVYREVNIPIIGCGGIEDWKDAIEFFLAGASAVQIGSSLVYGWDIVKKIQDGIISYMRKKGFRNIRELIGLAHKLDS